MFMLVKLSRNFSNYFSERSVFSEDYDYVSVVLPLIRRTLVATNNNIGIRAVQPVLSIRHDKTNNFSLSQRCRQWLLNQFYLHPKIK